MSMTYETQPGEQDFGGAAHPLLRAFLDLKVSMDRHTEELQATRQKAPIPVDVPFKQSGSYPSSGLLVLDLEGPPNGHVWIVQRLNVGGDTPTTTTAGRADFFMMPTRPTVSGDSAFQSGVLLNWVDQATSLPLASGYSARQITLRHPDHLWVVFSSGTNAQAYICVGSALQYTEAAYRQAFELG